MPSYEIPESIFSVPLFVPEVNDFFSIETAGLPNGEDCLIIHGNTSSDHKAYQALQTTSPAVFTTRTGSSFSISFWYKSAANGTMSVGGRSNMLFGVGKASANNPDSDSGWNFGGSSGDSGLTFWGMYQTSTSGNMGWARYMNGTGNSGGSNYSGLLSGASINNNTWHLITLVATSSAITMYLDASVTGNVGNVLGSGGAPSPIGDYFFSIGAYGTAARGRNVEYRMGKLCFHDHALNSTERALLYYSMV